MIILQLSDFHLNAKDIATEEGKSAKALRLAVDAVLTFPSPPDLLVISGDLADCGTQEEYDFCRQQLSRIHAPIVAVPGNHDNRQAMAQALPDFVGGAVGDFAGDFMVSSQSLGQLQVIALDSLVNGQAHGEVSPQQIEWLQGELDTHRDKKVIVVIHHPPFETGLAALDKMGLLQGKEALRECLAEAPNVIAVLCGHMHRHIIGQIGTVRAIVAPSVLMQFGCDLRRDQPYFISDEPAQFLVHQIDDAGEMTSFSLPITEPDIDPTDPVAFS